MQKLGIVAASVLSQGSSKATPTPIALRTDRPPSPYDSSTDREIPDRVVSYYEGDERRPVLRRRLTEAERAALDARASELRGALAPFRPEDQRKLGAAIARMLNGFSQMQRHDAAAAAQTTSAYLSTLRARPAWAIVEACERVRRGAAGSNPDFPPSEPRLNQIVSELIAPYRARLRKIEPLLAARCM
jgi:hypothetical protein